jgi:hypothetical protein
MNMYVSKRTSPAAETAENVAPALRPDVRRKSIFFRFWGLAALVVGILGLTCLAKADAVVSDGRFTNVYVFPNPSQETWEQHMNKLPANLKPSPPQNFTRQNIDAATEAMMSPNWPSYFGALYQYGGINPPRFFSSFVASQDCVDAAMEGPQQRRARVDDHPVALELPHRWHGSLAAGKPDIQSGYQDGGYLVAPRQRPGHVVRSRATPEGRGPASACGVGGRSSSRTFSNWRFGADKWHLLAVRGQTE